MHKFRNLDVYHKALNFSKAVRKTTRSFPREELFVLTSQFRRAADSIILNIAEGAGNSSRKEFSKFLGYAIRSGYESVACLDIAKEEDFLDAETHRSMFYLIDEIIAMLYGLRRSLTDRK